MNDIVFITGNQHKADYLATWLGMSLAHQKVDLEEIQSLDLPAVVEDKARRAYAVVQRPVLVEDVALSFDAFGHLPGTYIKWFIHEMGNEKLCRMVDGWPTRGAVASICYCIFDGVTPTFFEASMHGTIADHPAGANGFGWDELFIKDGMDKTRAELSANEEAETSMRRDALKELRNFLTAH